MNIFLNITTGKNVVGGAKNLASLSRNPTMPTREPDAFFYLFIFNQTSIKQTKVCREGAMPGDFFMAYDFEADGASLTVGDPVEVHSSEVRLRLCLYDNSTHNLQYLH